MAEAVQEVPLQFWLTERLSDLVNLTGAQDVKSKNKPTPYKDTLVIVMKLPLFIWYQNNSILILIIGGFSLVI